MVIAAVLFLMLTIGVIWFGFIKKPTETTQTAESETSLSFPKKIKINLQVFKNPIIEQLNPFEEIKPLEERPGRSDPFTKY